MAGAKVIHLDSNYLIYSLTNGSQQQAQVRAWLTAGEVLGISTVAWSEFVCGPLSPQDEAAARQLFPQAEALLTQDADKAAQLFNGRISLLKLFSEGGQVRRGHSTLAD